MLGSESSGSTTGLARGSSIKIKANMSARVGVRNMELRLGLELSLGFRFRIRVLG